jgi:hypothetical protein
MRLPAHMIMPCPMRPRWLAKSLSCDLICPKQLRRDAWHLFSCCTPRSKRGSGSDGKRAARGSRVERRRNALIKPDGGHRPRASPAILRFDFLLPHCAVRSKVVESPMHAQKSGVQPPNATNSDFEGRIGIPFTGEMGKNR